MANECFTRIEIGGNGTLVKELVSFVHSDRSQFDFERIAPTPPSVDTEDPFGPTYSKEWFSQNIGGAVYDYSVKFCPPCTFYLDTKWNPAIPVIRKLSARFPSLTIRAWFWEEAGSFAITAVFLGGVGIIWDVDPSSEAAHQIALMVADEKWWEFCGKPVPHATRWYCCDEDHRVVFSSGHGGQMESSHACSIEP